MKATSNCHQCGSVVYADALGRFRKRCYRCAIDSKNEVWNPTPEEIEAACVELRKEKDEKVRQKIKVGDMSHRFTTYKYHGKRRGRR